MAKTISTTSGYSDSWSKTHSQTQSQSESKSQSETKKVLDEELRDKILAGLMGYMTDEEMQAFAENLLKPQLNAGLEAAEQQYAATELAKKQEIENLAAALAKGIEQQEQAYGKSMANVQTAALARGMGRSSYTLQSLAQQGDALAKAVADLTGDTARQQDQIQKQISLAAQQKAQTTGRLNTDYAANLAAKVQELKQQQRQEYNQNYLTAISGSMGSASTGQQNTTGSSTTDSETQGHTDSHSTTITQSYGGGKKPGLGGNG
jgi:hypothetical protein